MCWLECSHRVVSVDHKVRSIDIVTLKNHLEDFRLVHSTFLHKLNHLVLHSDLVIDVVVQLGLHLILELTSFRQEIFIFWRHGEVLTVLGDEIEFADMGPGVESVTHWVHGPDSNILSTSEKVHLMDLLVQRFPV